MWTSPGTGSAHGGGDAPIDNATIASRFDEVSHLLDARGGEVYRVRAWRQAADAVRALDRPARVVFELEGLDGLDRIPSVGPVIARAIRSLVLTGRLPLLERLRAEPRHGSPLATVPGVGPVLARRLEEELGIGTLEELEIAAHDGTLEAVAGFGAKRVRGIQEALEGRLGQRRRALVDAGDRPPVAELLDVDREYREKAARGELRRIAPRRFNPEGDAWLPVLHTARGARHYTALFSNTALAHELGRTDDWVVLYYDVRGGESQCTVVTAARGPLRGRRVVRGRERECAAIAAAAPPARRRTGE